MGTGGARYRAGRPGWHLKAEHLRRIDVRCWQREGILRPGCVGGWIWIDPDTGELRASIGYAVGDDAVRLNFAINGEPVAQRVPILHTGCTYGGTRPWFGCPQCGRRMAVLFLAGRAFRCRHCARVVYLSQSLDEMDRAYLRQQKAKAKLNPDGTKPPRMHWATFERMRSFIDACEVRRNAAFLAMARRMLPGRFG